MGQFSFDPSSHVYRIQGRVVPSVTRVLDHSGCVDYSAIREDVLERASERGKRVHAATHFYDEGDLDWESVREEDKGYVDSWIGMREISGFVPTHCEFQQIACVDGHAYGMRVDAVGRFHGKGRETVIDRKTGPVQHWVRWQTAGYAAGFCDPPDNASPLSRFLKRDRGAVQLFPDGRPGKLTMFEDRTDYYAFSAMLFVSHIKLAAGMAIKEIA